ncbi:MAG: DUF1929 domain-containing protein [Solirubrobacterales bacterium]|nr:DUF1929 domain-containing protein [Solirubrobacterales bacterium]MBV9717336.1 DUF1929 domain-containing protein [Solirubrobacterales bacterium]
MTKPRRSAHLRRVHGVVAAVLVCALLAVNGPPVVAFIRDAYHNIVINTASYKRRYGHWSVLPVPSNMRVNAVHAIMLHTGKVLIMAGSGNDAAEFAAGKFVSVIWNPANNSFKKITTPTDMFCGGHVILPDGKVLIGGGTTRYEVERSQIEYAAGVMTVTNTSPTASTTLPAGTVFRSRSGYLFKSVSATAIPKAQRKFVGAGAQRKAVVVPSNAPLWVTATERGDAPVSRTFRTYGIEGLASGYAAAMTATSWNLTRDIQTFWGSRVTYLFDPVTERYEKLSDMNLARWYPSLVGLTNGKVLAVSGLDGLGQMIDGNTEEWDPGTHEWTIDKTLTRPFPTYPALFLLPDGNLFFTGSSAGYGPVTAAWRTPGIWNPMTNAFTPVYGMRDADLTETSASVLLPPAQNQRYAIIGGGGAGQTNTGTGRIDVVDLNSRNPRWQPAGSLPEQTRYPEAIVTPDDRVVIAGGSKYYRGEEQSDIFECHLYNPQTGKVSTLASPTVGRDYHSEALLLADGRILTLGGNPLFGNKADTTPGYFEQRIEIYSPPYLYRGARPRLTAGPTEVRHGQTVLFATPDAAKIATARLIRPSAVTHVTDLEQRSIALGLRRMDSAVALTVPTGSGLVPPGWYMLFVTAANGTPSVARWVHVD